jgi:P4 family phage/plasmid primase-like protien
MNLPSQFIADAARTYLHAGLSVGPIPPNAKYPIAQGWKTYQSRLPTPDELAAWFDGRSAMGLCIFCGQVSGGVEVLDFDELDTYHAFAQLVQELGYDSLLQRLLIEHTPRPGIHLAYLCDEIVGNTKLARVKIGVLANGKDDVKTLIETRGEGGLIVVAPTPPGIHPDVPERGYELIQGDWTKLPRITTEAREILWNCARALNRYDDQAPRQYGEPQSDQDRVGSDYNATVTQDEVQRLLEADGWTCTVSRGDERYLLRPGKSGRGWSATLGVLAPKRLYVFSTNAAPFDHDRSYDPFGVYMRLKHGGDAKAAAKALATMGYGRNGHPPHHAADDAPDAPVEADEIHLTDRGNALRLVRAHGHTLHYLYWWKQWLSWKDGRWAIDDGNIVESAAKGVVAELYRWAAAKLLGLAETTELSFTDPDNKAHQEEVARVQSVLKWAHKSEGAPRIHAMVDLARSEHGIPVSPEQLDANPWLLNCRNGTIDLRTGHLRPHRRGDLLTKHIPLNYDPHATCPQWQAFLWHVMGGPARDEDGNEQVLLERHERATRLVEFLQRAVGYSLTGVIREHVLFFLYGKGANGKSTFSETLAELLGDYYQKAPQVLLMQRDRLNLGGPSPELARLFRARMVMASEVDKQHRLNESQVKDLTGDDKIVARHLFEPYFEFRPTHKLWLYGNHKPIISGTDEAIWRRPKLIPFTVTIPEAERNPKFREEFLLPELSGILTWAVQGCLSWQKDGLQVPQEVEAATKSYRLEMDTIAQFLAAVCRVHPGHPEVKIASGLLYDEFVKWAGERLMSQKAFSAALEEAGYTKARGGDGRWYWRTVEVIPAPTNEDDDL